MPGIELARLLGRSESLGALGIHSDLVGSLAEGILSLREQVITALREQEVLSLRSKTSLASSVGANASLHSAFIPKSSARSHK